MNPLKRCFAASTVIWASLFSATAFVALTSTTGEKLTASENAAAFAASENFVYFPSQYVNRATEPGEPIQGF